MKNKNLNKELIAIHLSMAVPLVIRELEKRGGPTPEALNRVSEFALKLGEYGDQLLYGGPKTSELMNELVEGIAIMAFIPGGAKVFGMHFIASGVER